MQFLIDFYERNFNLIVGCIAVTITYVLYQGYAKFNAPVYENVKDNEAHLRELRAARAKQQEKFNDYITENAEELKKNTEKSLKELNKHMTDVRKMRLGEIPTSNTPASSATREFFPLMGDPGTDTGYKPTKKKPPGGCSGGGCG